MRWLLLALLLPSLVAVDDDAAELALDALDNGRVAQAQAIISVREPRADFDVWRLLRGRVATARDDLTVARELLALDQEPWPWPEALRSQAWRAAGEWSLAAGAEREDFARAALCFGRALEAGPRTGLDGLLALIASASAAAGDEGNARRASERLWYGWPESVHWADAGLSLMRAALAADQRAEAQRIAAVLEQRASLTAEQALRLVLLRCHSYWPARPSRCLDLVDEAQRHGLTSPALDEWRQRVHERLQPESQPGVAQAGEPETGWGRALLAWRSGDLATASAALREAEEPWAQALLASWSEDPSACYENACRVPLVAVAWLARFCRVDPAVIACVREADVEALSPAGPVAAHVARWLWQLAEADGLAGELREQVLAALRGTEMALPEVGMAWCLTAQQHEREGDAEQAQQAWAMAAQRLDPGHEWAVIAAISAAKPLMAGVPPGAAAPDHPPAELHRARDLLGTVAWLGDGEPQLRARFLLAQVLAQLGLKAEAEMAIASLLSHADPTRAKRLLDFRQRLGYTLP